MPKEKDPLEDWALAGLRLTHRDVLSGVEHEIHLAIVHRMNDNQLELQFMCVHQGGEPSFLEVLPSHERVRLAALFLKQKEANHVRRDEDPE